MPVLPTEVGKVAVPSDTADLLGDDAKLEVGPGHIVTQQPSKLRTATLVAAAGAEALDGPARLRHSTSPLTEDERAALAEFLAG